MGALLWETSFIRLRNAREQSHEFGIRQARMPLGAKRCSCGRRQKGIGLPHVWLPLFALAKNTPKERIEITDDSQRHGARERGKQSHEPMSPKQPRHGTASTLVCLKSESVIREGECAGEQSLILCPGKVVTQVR